MDTAKDPLYIALHNKSYCDNDWRGKVLLAILQVAVDDFLNPKSSLVIKKQAEHFIFNSDGNMMFNLCMAVLGTTPEVFRNRIRHMKDNNLRLRKYSERKTPNYNMSESDFEFSTGL